jgi:hypothetical protein
MERPWSKPIEGAVKVNFDAAFYDISGSGAWVLLQELIREKPLGMDRETQAPEGSYPC